MADVPELPADARRRIEIAAEKARIQLRATQRQCFIRDPWCQGTGEVGLDSKRCTKVSETYALDLFSAKASEYSTVKSSYETFRGWLSEILEETMADTSAQWRRLNYEDRSRLEMVCLPKVRAALRNARDQWLLRRLDVETTGIGEATAHTVASEVQPELAAEGTESPRCGEVRKALAKKRLGLLRAKLGAGDMADLGRRLGVSRSALYGMCKGDTARYSTDTETKVLRKLHISEAEWNPL